MKWIVQHRDELSVSWGPFETREDADRFARFAQAEIDPVVVRRLRDPLGEVLNYHQALVLDKNESPS